jgi:uncharacterized delta-60 repeat protein
VAQAVDVEISRKGIVVAGTVGPFDDARIVVARYGELGKLDPTFGSDGIVVVDFPAGAIAEGLALQPNGRMVVAGSTSRSDGWRFALARLMSDGSLDPTFGGDGTLTTAVNGQS